MAVSHADCENTSEEVEIAVAFDIVEVHPVAAGQGERLAVIGEVAGPQVLTLLLEDGLGIHVKLLWNGSTFILGVSYLIPLTDWRVHDSGLKGLGGILDPRMLKGEIV